jgi:hypothetical protein
VRYNPRPVRRLFRILLNALTAVSVLLCIGASVLWVRNYWAGEFISVESRHGTCLVGASRGQLLCHGADEPLRWRLEHFRHDPAIGIGIFWISGIREGVATHGSAFKFVNRGGKMWRWASFKIRQGRHHYLMMPVWALCAVFAILPGVRLAVRLRVLTRRQAGSGLCVFCGYDLCATPERCPECGCVSPASPSP